MLTFPTFPILSAWPKPRTSAEAKRAVADENAKNKRKRDAAEAQRRQQQAELDAIIRRAGAKPASTSRGAVRPAAAAARRIAPPKAAAKPPASRGATIDSQALYRARNRPRGTCDACGSHVGLPAHGRVVDNIEAPPKRTLAEIIADRYGTSGGASDALIGTSRRGGR